MFTTIINHPKYALYLGAMVLFTMFSCQDNTLTEIQEDIPQLEEGVDESVIPNHYVVQFEESFIAPSSSRSEVFTDRNAKVAFSKERQEIADREINSFLDKANIAQTKVAHRYSAAIAGFAAELTKEQVKQLKANPNVLSVEPDRLMELELPRAEGRVTMETPEGARADYVDCAISNACGYANGASSGKWIWILDTGIDLNHPDLNVLGTAPYAQNYYGASPDDDNGHGTHVAGIAAAKSNGFGVVGVSAGARVVPVKVLNSAGSGSYSNIIAGINHVRSYDIPGDVVNMSLSGYMGSGCASSSYRTSLLALASEGTRVAMAAGNSNNYAGYYFPACINSTNLYTVAAMDCNKTFATYSNYTRPPVDYIATGTNVWSTWMGGGYRQISGTSMASPVVAGILHQRQAAPVINGWVYKSTAPTGWYPIACR